MTILIDHDHEMIIIIIMVTMMIMMIMVTMAICVMKSFDPEAEKAIRDSKERAWCWQMFVYLFQLPRVRSFDSILRIADGHTQALYLIFVIFLHSHILSPGNFTLIKCVNLRQICPRQNSVNHHRWHFDILYTFRELNISLSVKLHTECKILHSVQHYTLSVKLHTECKITHLV